MLPEARMAVLLPELVLERTNMFIFVQFSKGVDYLTAVGIGRSRFSIVSRFAISQAV